MVSEGEHAAESTSESGVSEAEEHSTVVYIDLWVFVALLLACVIYHYRDTVRLPTSGLLMLAGIFLRCVGPEIGLLKETVELLDEIEAETILLIFLPALISECAFQIDWYTFKREIVQITLLATTAVVLSSFLTAIVIRYILGYEEEFGWYSALMLGAILSATDHVAVVAQLKEVNADYRLETLMQGETLVNDGTVMVMFTAMKKGAIGEASTAGDIVELFFRLSLGGLALGLGFGICLAFWLKKVVNKAVLETLLTLLTAYLLFFTADATKVHFSGALATVTLGLFMSAYGKTMISPAVEKTVHQFWSTIGTSIEALILILGGMLMGHFFINFEILEDSDIGMLFALFALIHVVRAVTVLIHWPVLRMFGYGCSAKEMTVLVFGALKGTMSVALSLMVFHNTGFEERARDLVLFWSVGISALSTMFDALLLHFIVRVLGLESMTDVEEHMLVSVTTSINASTHSHIKKLKKDEEYSLANWEEIMIDAGPDTLMKDIINATQNGRRIHKSQQVSSEIVRSFTSCVRITDTDIVYETRRRFYTTLKGLYWELFEEGQCFGDSALVLTEAANRGLDNEKEVMKDWEELEPKVFPIKLLRFLRWASHSHVIGWAFRWLLYSYITAAYDIGRNFVRAHTEAEELLDDMEIDIKKDVFEHVMKEMKKQVELAEAFLNGEIRDVYPEVVIFVQTKQVSTIILHREQKSIEEIFEKGVITEIEYKELSKSVNRKIERLERHSRPKKPTLMELLRSCALFKDVETEKLQSIASKLEEEHLTKDETLFMKNQPGTGFYVVMRGRIKEIGKGFELDHSAGDVVGSQFLLPDYHPPASTATAHTSARVVFISHSDINDLFLNIKFERKVWLMGARKLFAISKESFGELGQLDPSHLNVVITNSAITRYSKGDTVPMAYGTIFLQGGVSTGAQALSYVPGVDKAQAVAAGPTVVLHFHEDFGKFVRSAETDLRTAITKFELQGKGAGGFKMVKKPHGGDSSDRQRLSVQGENFDAAVDTGKQQFSESSAGKSEKTPGGS